MVGGSVRRALQAILVLCAISLGGGQTFAGQTCPPCLAFDRLDKQIRDGVLPKGEARRQFAARIADLDAYLAGASAPASGQWIFPLHGYTLAIAGAEAAKGYVAAGYDYFDGNRHSGHPSYDLFIRDRNQDSLDDRTGQPVTVASMTGGIVVAIETAWDQNSALRGGKYLWVYDSTNHTLVYYAHNRDILVGIGEQVHPGTPLATVGRSGFNAAKQRSPTHLHLTVLSIRNGRPVPEDIHRQLATLRPLPQ